MHMIKGASLFANVGIGELYLPEVGVNIVVANELLPERAKFYSENHPNSKMICGDITDNSIYEKFIALDKK
jgi:DNA (cytosine-5)-methyltransferase 1